jgi:hypothetical protein
MDRCQHISRFDFGLIILMVGGTLALIWYDILHVMDVLTRFPWARSEKRLL